MPVKRPKGIFVGGKEWFPGMSTAPELYRGVVNGVDRAQQFSRTQPLVQRPSTYTAYAQRPGGEIVGGRVVSNQGGPGAVPLEQLPSRESMPRRVVEPGMRQVGPGLVPAKSITDRAMDERGIPRMGGSTVRRPSDPNYVSEMEITARGVKPSEKSRRERKRAEILAERNAAKAVTEAEQARTDEIAAIDAQNKQALAEGKQRYIDGPVAEVMAEIQKEAALGNTPYEVDDKGQPVVGEDGNPVPNQAYVTKQKTILDARIKEAEANGDFEAANIALKAKHNLIQAEYEAKANQAAGQTEVTTKPVPGGGTTTTTTATGTIPAAPVDNMGGADADNNGVPDADKAANGRVNFMRSYERVMKQNPNDPYVTQNAAAYEQAKIEQQAWASKQKERLAQG